MSGGQSMGLALAVRYGQHISQPLPSYANRRAELLSYRLGQIKALEGVNSFFFLHLKQNKQYTNTYTNYFWHIQILSQTN
jgi:hypothetical protein